VNKIIHWDYLLYCGGGLYTGNALDYAKAIREAFEKSSVEERKRKRLCPDNDYDLLVLLVQLYSEVINIFLTLKHNLKTPPIFCVIFLISQK
jgi:hypothetical protein